MLKPKDVSKMLGVTTQTLRNWDREEVLVARRIDGSNHRYYEWEDIERFKISRKPHYVFEEIFIELFNKFKYEELLPLLYINTYKDHFGKISRIATNLRDLGISNQEQLSPEELLIFVQMYTAFSRLYNYDIDDENRDDRKYKDGIKRFCETFLIATHERFESLVYLIMMDIKDACKAHQLDGSASDLNNQKMYEFIPAVCAGDLFAPRQVFTIIKGCSSDGDFVKLKIETYNRGFFGGPTNLKSEGVLTETSTVVLIEDEKHIPCVEYMRALFRIHILRSTNYVLNYEAGMVLPIEAVHIDINGEIHRLEEAKELI